MYILLGLAIILIGAKIGGLAAKKLGQPSVVGEIIIGIVLGPYVLSVIQPTDFIRGLGEIGIVLLMFLIGLHTDIKRFEKLFTEGFTIAFLGVVTPLILGSCAGMLLGWDLAGSVFLGGILMATSVSITSRALSELGKLKSRAGTAILDAAVADDIIGVIAFIFLLAVLGGRGFDPFQFLLTISGIGLFFFIVLKLSKRVLIPFLKFGEHLNFRVKEGLFSLILALILFFAFVSKSVGLSAILGSFLLGLVIPHREVKRVQHEIYAISYGFAIPIFFTYVGVLLNPVMIAFSIVPVSIILFVAVISKIMGCSLASLPFGFNKAETLLIGFGMVPRMEVAIVMAELGRNAGLISSSNFSMIISVLVLTILITPVLLKMTVSRYGKMLK